MRYAMYDSYSDSGLDWFKKYPSHWNIRRLKWTIDHLKNGVWGAEPDGLNDIVVLRVADFDRTSLRVSEDSLTLRSVDQRERNGRLLSFEDLLIEKSGGGEKQLVGAVVQFTKEFPAITSNFIATMQPGGGFSSRFLTYLHFHLYTSKVNYRSIKQTTGIQNLDATLYFDEIVALPTLEEQTQIAKFLDYKTAQIDALIVKKKELIEKLKEQRLAVITQAVNKGLNPSTPVRDSGISWLGQVPQHWKVRRLKFSISIKGGGTPNTNIPEYWEGDIPWVSPKDMKGNYISTTQDYITELGLVESASTLIDSNTVLIVVRSGILRHTIPVAINLVPVAINQDMKALIPSEDTFDPNYLMALIFGNQHALLPLWSKPGCTVESIESEYMMNSLLPLPPKGEQEQIASEVNNIKTKIDAMQSKIELAIDRLAEYRTALITAATTGKIDVRNIKLGKAK